MAKVIPNMDESNWKRELLKGGANRMHTALNAAETIVEKRKDNSLKRISITLSENESTAKKSRFDLKYNLEGVSYWFFKLISMISIIALFDLQYDLFSGFLLYKSLVALIFLYLISGYHISKNEIESIHERRLSAGQFFSQECRFALGLCVLIYISGLNIKPVMTGLILLVHLSIQVLLLVLWKKYFHRAFRKLRNQSVPKRTKNAIIIGSSWRGKAIADLFLNNPDFNINTLGFIDFDRTRLWRYRDIPLLGNTDYLADIISEHQVDYIILASEPDDYHQSREIFELIERMGISICVFPDFYDFKTSTCQPTSINGKSMLHYRPTGQSRFDLFAKNVADKVGAFCGLLIATPILIAAAIAIKIDSRGPVFFKQKRCGKNGRTFEMLKLRTMANGADGQKDKLLHMNEMSGPVFKIKKDPRITRVGKFLRKFSIDEFPQFINILKGDMSLVGPRPPLPAEVAKYEPWQRRRLSVKPGATCLWQINGRNQVDFNEWMKLDIEYIDNWSIKEDIRILLKTFPAVMKGNGAT